MYYEIINYFPRMINTKKYDNMHKNGMFSALIFISNLIFFMYNLHVINHAAIDNMHLYLKFLS